MIGSVASAQTVSELILILGAPPPCHVKQWPCDIYAFYGTACKTAYSTTRAMSSTYNGNLYQVERTSDSTTQNIGVISPGGSANISTYNTFCSGTVCNVSLLYDQIGSNNLSQATVANQMATAPAATGSTGAVAATTLATQWLRNRGATGLPTGSSPQTEYMVVLGGAGTGSLTHSNAGCCWDAGNMEATVAATGNGHMNALQYGLAAFGSGWPGSGSGPWAMVDLENGSFAGPNAGANPGNTGNLAYTVGVLEKCDCTANFVIKGANLPATTWTTFYSTGFPSGYGPLHMEGGISIGEGGDGSNSGSGGFLEFALVGAETSDVADNAVMANVNAFYTNTRTYATNVPATLGAGLLAWWDGSDQTTYTFGTGNHISAWKDKSSHAYSAAQGTAANQPIYVPSYLNSRSVVAFNGTSDQLQSGDSDTIFSNPFTIYMVIQPTYMSGFAVPFAQATTSGGFNHPCLTEHNSVLGLAGCGQTFTASSLTMAYGGAYIIHWTSAGIATAGGTFTATPTVNGTTLSPVAVTQASYVSTGLSIGGDFPEADYFSGMIAEIVAVSGQDTTAASQKMDGYLACKWGLQSLLPTSHPNYSVCP